LDGKLGFNYEEVIEEMIHDNGEVSTSGSAKPFGYAVKVWYRMSCSERLPEHFVEVESTGGVQYCSDSCNNLREHQRHLPIGSFHIFCTGLRNAVIMRPFFGGEKDGDKAYHQHDMSHHSHVNLLPPLGCFIATTSSVIIYSTKLGTTIAVHTLF